MGIARNESVLALYRGLGAVLMGMAPKMAIRFTSFEQYKILLRDSRSGTISRKGTFVGKLFHSKDQTPTFYKHKSRDNLSSLQEMTGNPKLTLHHKI